LVLTPWSGSWDSDDPDANFKEEVTAYGLLDPLETLNGLANSLDIPIGALARYVLAKWATGGSEGMLHLGSSTVQRMRNTCDKAEERDTEKARLSAYNELREIIEWLYVPIEDPEVYEN
tara:strand:+ start:26826 stop:27182 length:357 start_codon:yes stop_codon:yes gene_type:complete